MKSPHSDSVGSVAPVLEKKLPAWLTPVLAIIGPAAVMTAGIMGPGSTSAFLLAGTYFGYDLLWAALLALIPIVFCLDSAARVGIMTGGKGMLSIIRDEIHPLVTWFVLAVMVLFNLFVIMAMFSMMASSALSFAGYYFPMEGASQAYVRGYEIGKVVFALFFASGGLALLLTGNYKRVQKLMTALLFLVFLCYAIVAIRGLQDIAAIASGLAPKLPEDLPIPGTNNVRDAYWQMIAIIGGGLAPAPILSFSYFVSDDNARPEDIPRYFWRSLITLGGVYGAYSILVMVAGGFVLHRLPNYASIQSVHEAGQVLAYSFPGALGALGPRLFALGMMTAAFNAMVVISQLMCYFVLDTLKMPWRYEKRNTPFRLMLVFWVFVPALLSTFWQFPPLLQMILLMGLNSVLVPLAIGIVLYLINRRAIMGNYKANAGRNIILVASLILALWLSLSRAPHYVRNIRQELDADEQARIERVYTPTQFVWSESLDRYIRDINRATDKL